MQRTRLSTGRLLAVAIFALSCFALLLFLWLSFGGAVPLKPKGYRFHAAFPEAITLATESDVRIAGVPVGKVKTLRLDPSSRRTLATIELDDEHAPVPVTTRAILRQKTLLGESYVELRPGGGPMLEDGGRLPDGRVVDTVQLDEILDALDRPTRRALQTWQRAMGRAVADAGPAISRTAGNAPAIVDEGTRLLRTLEQQEVAVRALLRNGGETLAALTEREGRLRDVVRGTDTVFATTARRQERLGEAVRILPTFLDEARLTLTRTERFARTGEPLLRELRPALAALPPAFEDLERMAPDLRALAAALDPLVRAGRRGLPAATGVLEGVRPLLAATGPFLSELNPVLEWLEYNQRLVAGLFNGVLGVVDTVPTQTDREVGHYLRAIAPLGPEALAMYGNRLPSNRGNAYLSPVAGMSRRLAHEMILPSWDCDNTGRGEFTTRKGGTNDQPSCWTSGFPGLTDRPRVLPRVERADYTRPADAGR